VNPPFDYPNNAGSAPNEFNGGDGLEDAGPKQLSTETGPELAVREASSPHQPIIDFHRRLFELTPRVLVTRAIVAVNVVVFALMAISSGTLLSPGGELLIKWGADFGPKTLDDQWWRVFTSMFVHVGIIHLGFNMWVLWDAGHLVERLVGNVGFLVLYVVSGVFGSLASVYWNPHVLSAGASGAVFGVFGALMGFIMLRGDSVPKSILGQLRNSGLAFLGYNLVFGFAITWIDNAAHIGGLAAGFVCGVLMSHPLDRVTGTSRFLRNVATAAIAAIGVLVALHIAPDAPDAPDVVLRRLEDFLATEKSVLDTLGTARQRRKDNEITEDEFAGIVDADVLQPWREARRELDRMNNVRADQKQLVLKLREYAKAREEAWEALLVAVREPSDERTKEYERKNAAVEALLDDSNSK